MAALAAEPGQAGLLSRAQAVLHYDEAAREAVLACADTAGQRCYICFGEGDEDEGLVLGCACRLDNGFAHVSCLARGAQAAVERDADTGWARWYICGLCEQEYHGVVRCALGWSCWKTYLGRPETDQARRLAMNLLGLGLFDAKHCEDALSVQEAELSLRRRLDDSEENILVAQGNLAVTYQRLGRLESALQMKRDVYSGYLKLHGEEHEKTLLAANNYSTSLIDLQHSEEVKSLMRKTIPVAQRVLGESHNLTLRMKWNYARALYRYADATLDDLSEAVTRLEDAERTARRVFGGTHPITKGIGFHLRESRAALRARETRDDETVDVPAQEDPPPPPPPPPPPRVAPSPRPASRRARPAPLRARPPHAAAR